jgi:NAD(P)-dependent dehydrogenase (short-subunit alcohol dehydrogenase family)
MSAAHVSDRRPVALVVGVGDATGSAIARRFARGGFAVVAVRRNADKLTALVQELQAEGLSCLAQSVDARQEEAVQALVDRIEREIGPLHAVIFNIGANVWSPVTQVTTRVFTKVWEMACLSGFLTGREAARVMLPRGQGSIFFTGATASLRGRAGFSAFAAAKHGLRAVAQSMARELGPQGIHVAHLVVDGAIDTEFIRDNLPEKYELKEQAGIVNPESIAQAYWALHHQPRDAWTHELDLRPWMEPF